MMYIKSVDNGEGIGHQVEQEARYSHGWRDSCR